MRVLVVEDDQDFVEELTITLARLLGPPEVTVARSRDSAYALLTREFFDLLILDLKIPTVDTALDADAAHGRAVFGRVLQVAPGTPVFVLTGSPAEDFIGDMLTGARHVDIWGEGREHGTVSFLKKNMFAEAETRLAPIAQAVCGLNDIEFNRGNAEITIEDDRLIRIFTRRVGGARCVASRIGGGLSGAKVVRLKITDSSGAGIHDAIGKLGSIRDVQDESRRFDNHISRLANTATPRKLQTLEFGAKAHAAVFYGLEPGFDFDGFTVCQRQGDLPSRVPAGVRNATERWRREVGETRRSIGDVRRLLLSDADCERVTRENSMTWVQDFENRLIQTRWCVIHTDLHGGNVLAAEDGSCVLIDYGDVAEGPASLDPITLELCLNFHPDGPLKNASWPKPGQGAHWASLDEYLKECPASNFIRACREWALDVAAGQREVAASAYAYLMRQLKYSDTNKNLAMELLIAVHAWYMSST
jgi:CheY-like chemotaxis protein